MPRSKSKKKKSPTTPDTGGAALNAACRALASAVQPRSAQLVGPRPHKGPHLRPAGRASYALSGSEMITSVSTATGYTGVAISVNPLSATVFPRLSGVASAFQRYRFKRLRLVYEPTCPVTEAGRVVLAYIEDSTATLPVDMAGLANLDGSDMGTVTSRHECRPGRLDSIERYCGVTQDGDLNKSTTGSFLVALDGGVNDTNAAGDIWLEYEVVLMDARPVHELQAVLANTTSPQVATSSPQTVYDYVTGLELPHWLSSVGALGLRAADEILEHGALNIDGVENYIMSLIAEYQPLLPEQRVVSGHGEWVRECRRLVSEDIMAVAREAKSESDFAEQLTPLLRDRVLPTRGRLSFKMTSGQRALLLSPGRPAYTYTVRYCLGGQPWHDGRALDVGYEVGFRSAPAPPPGTRARTAWDELMSATSALIHYGEREFYSQLCRLGSTPESYVLKGAEALDADRRPWLDPHAWARARFDNPQRPTIWLDRHGTSSGAVSGAPGVPEGTCFGFILPPGARPFNGGLLRVPLGFEPMVPLTPDSVTTTIKVYDGDGVFLQTAVSEMVTDAGVINVDFVSFADFDDRARSAWPSAEAATGEVRLCDKVVFTTSTLDRNEEVGVTVF